ncbi:MAG: hypothetical protein U1E03_14530 [Hyphomonadaceae bacterium]
MLILIAGISSCAGGADPALGDCRAVRAQYSLDANAWHAYDFETQYRIYMCANQDVLPHRGGETLLADEGADMAHFLARKLDATNYDLTIHEIVAIFAVMQTRRTFDATADPALMALLDRKVASLTGPGDGAIRESAEHLLKTIQGGPGAPLP